MDNIQRFQEDLRILREQTFNLANTVHKLVCSIEHLNERMQTFQDKFDHLEME